MSIEWLEDKHLHMLACGEDEPKEYAKLSIEFAISVLEEIQPGSPFIDINDKIQELKTYLDEK